MSSRFDGHAILAAIAAHPAAFPALKADVDTAARKLLLKQLKTSSMTLDLIRLIVASVGETGVRFSFDEMGAKDLAAIAHRLDPANAALLGMSEAELGDHICALGKGSAKPMPGKKVAVRAPSKKPKKELSKIGEILNSKVHSGEPIERPVTPKPPRAKKASGKTP